ncbi:MAG: hypothetical protein ACYC96_15415 [Fimbriimonadaceae bacterium]
MRRRLALVFAVVSLACGCGKPAADVIGKWHVDPTAFADADPQYAATSAKFAEALTLEFKADKTFAGTVLQGTYAVSGNTVTLTPTGPGAASEKPAQATLSNDGQSLTVSYQGKPMKFVRSK